MGDGLPKPALARRANVTDEHREEARRLKRVWDIEKDCRGFTQEQAASRMGYATQAAVSQYLNAKIPLNLDSALKFANFLRCRVSDFSPRLGLLLQDYETGAAQSPLRQAAIRADGPVITRRTPIVGNTQAGPDVAWEENGYPPGYGEAYVEQSSKNPRCYALRVIGNSMAPRMVEGDCVVCDPDAEPYPGLEVVVTTATGECMVKRLAYHRAGEIALDSIGHGYDRIVLSDADIALMHPVISIATPASIRRDPAPPPPLKTSDSDL